MLPPTADPDPEFDPDPDPDAGLPRVILALRLRSTSDCKMGARNIRTVSERFKKQKVP